MMCFAYSDGPSGGSVELVDEVPITLGRVIVEILLSLYLLPFWALIM